MANDLVQGFRTNCDGVIKEVKYCYNHLANKPTFKTINGNEIIGTGDITVGIDTEGLNTFPKAKAANYDFSGATLIFRSQTDTTDVRIEFANGYYLCDMYSAGYTLKLMNGSGVDTGIELSFMGFAYGNEYVSITFPSDSGFVVTNAVGTYIDDLKFDAVIPPKVVSKIEGGDGIKVTQNGGTYTIALMGVDNFPTAFDAGFNFNGKKITITDMNYNIGGSYEINFANGYKITGFGGGGITIAIYNPYYGSNEIDQYWEGTQITYTFRDGSYDIGTNCIISDFRIDGNVVNSSDFDDYITITFTVE